MQSISATCVLNITPDLAINTWPPSYRTVQTEDAEFDGHPDGIRVISRGPDIPDIVIQEVVIQVRLVIHGVFHFFLVGVTFECMHIRRNFSFCDWVKYGCFLDFRLTLSCTMTELDLFIFLKLLNVVVRAIAQKVPNP